MPYYPQSPGFYPPLNSVTDAQLVDMPDGTVKGRALGAGLGDPTNLTPAQLQALISPVGNSMLATMPDATLKGRALGAGVGVPTDLTITQLQALLGNPTYTQCRLVYISSSTMRLIRFGGKFLTIDDTPRLIPTAGVDLVVIATFVGANPLYVYARITGSTMTLQGAGEAAVVDPRNGMMVHPSDPSISLVGMAYVYAGPTLTEDGANQAVSSYYNRMPRSYGYQQQNTTTSTGMVPLHNPIKLLLWGDSSFRFETAGYTQLSGVSSLISQLLMDGGGFGPAQVTYFPVANGQNPIALVFAGWGSAGLHSFQLGGYVNGFTGTWTATSYGTVNG